ncbi:hypothetical protein FRC05_002826 [Tulasnella sp. 425]|nr:hypothetical protein FRC05_002826 [Tulasnella sp. 425]
MLHLNAIFKVLCTSLNFSSGFARESQDFRRLDSSRNGSKTPTKEYFDQLINHLNPSLGTFKQRYFFSDQHYNEQGSPIVIETSGKHSADRSKLTEGSKLSMMLKTLGAAPDSTLPEQ